MTLGILGPEACNPCRVSTDDIRAVEVGKAYPAIDVEWITVKRTSQGGGLAPANGGLEPDVAGVLPDVPLLCHYRRATENTDRAFHTLRLQAIAKCTATEWMRSLGPHPISKESISPRESGLRRCSSGPSCVKPARLPRSSQPTTILAGPRTSGSTRLTITKAAGPTIRSRRPSYWASPGDNPALVRKVVAFASPGVS